MAEIEEVIEGVEEAIDGAEEGIEELPEEIREEVEAEIAEARVEVSRFSRVTETLKSFLEMVTTSIPKVARFVGKNVAIGAILWGVNTGLDKLAQHHQTTDVKKKRNAIKALTTVIKTETELSQKVLDWMKEHKDDTIVLDGFEIPLESVIAKYMTPISESVDAAFKIAQRLQDKLDGKTVFNVPTGGDMKDFLVAGDAYLKGFSDLIQFISTNVSKFPVLGTFPVKQADVDQLTDQLNEAKSLPLW
ncbi:uncharacterized protein LOC125009152 [Mugil cephalus]|uniref:uncharacterized protein LOC125009152 n=1 Tax=Mugil cephalus TaxID=48193 RepID=UPI001FB584D1|nr:uncharacterized protein LOC125009152 [Mugil cephalus]XP_047442800.1 uncharacterized protein LOC125009152 [Mugil cephalus]XP_047442802.1 uncharacterized protein LOC125009152 [Mugil cephalus]